MNAGMAYESLKNGGCTAGGIAIPPEVISSGVDMGGKSQKKIGCTSDAQCHDDNLCLGVQLCNVTSNMCYTQENSVPNCDDGVKVSSFAAS